MNNVMVCWSACVWWIGRMWVWILVTVSRPFIIVLHAEIPNQFSFLSWVQF